MKTKYVIRSLERYDDMAPCLFVAIHGYSSFYTGYTSIAKARKFDTEAEARAYALAKLFTHEAGAFDIIPDDASAPAAR